jgi:hypothetical protein
MAPDELSGHMRSHKIIMTSPKFALQHLMITLTMSPELIWRLDESRQNPVKLADDLEKFTLKFAIIADNHAKSSRIHSVY